MSSQRLFAFAFVAIAVACGGGGSGKPTETAGAAPTESGPGDPMSGATVYDELGKSHGCALPKNSCPDMKERPREFKDKCALEGYRIVQCGCEQFCTGNAMADQLHYDASNAGKLCAKPKDDCEPPETSSAFQDACTAAKGKFVVCGCEWLCSKKLRAAVPGKPPADEPEEPEAPKPTEPE